MDWLKKLLEGKGLSEEQINEITKGVDENYKGYVPKHRFEEVNESKKELEKGIKERDQQLTELKKSVGDNEDFKKQIETLQQENKTKEQDYQAKIQNMAKETAIKLAVSNEAHDPDLIATLLDKTKIEVDENGAIKTGLDDQLKSLRESKAFLFAQKEPETKETTIKGATPVDGTGTQISGVDQIAQTIRSNLGF